MKHPETNSNQPLLIERPLFSSPLLALFMVLRKNYYERNVVATKRTVNLKTMAKEQTDIEFNQI
jgi:hypothetical protein